MKHFLQKASMICALIILLITPKLRAQFAKGADVSWMTEMENAGYTWYNDNGTQQDLFTILKAHEMNAIRLRVWVNPSDGWCNLSDMLAKAQRANNAGMDIMLSIHYSDSWADPGQQNKPSSWSGYSTQQLYDAVYNYTYDIVNTLATNGITPKWVQIGNETNDGMLWDNGRASQNMQTYAWLINSGHNAVKAINSNILTVVHLANGDDNALYQWNIGGIISNGANFDVIGMSLYPEPSTWSTMAANCYSNMVDMKSRYGKEVMICEIGMRQDEPETTRSFVQDMISKTRSAGGLGVFYWEPQIYNGWKSYGKGAWGENGRPTVALDGFIENTNSTTSYVQLLNRGTGLYLDGMGYTTNGAACGQYANTAHVNSQWEMIDQGNNYYQLRNRGTGLYLDGMGRTTNGSDVGQWGNTTHYNSHWEVIQYSGNYYRLRNRGTGLYLDGMGRTSNGSNAGQWANTTHVNAQWQLISMNARMANTIDNMDQAAAPSIYPNTVYDYFTIESSFNEDSHGTLKIYDLSGHLITQKSLTQATQSINVSDFAAGIYLLETNIDGVIHKTKLIKK